MSDVMAIVLAAGKGTRMQSDLPKVLCRVCGRPLIDFVLDALFEAGVRRIIVVVGYGGNDVRRALSQRDGIEFVEQKQQLGTGHAVMSCREKLIGFSGGVLILAGDSPLTQASTLQALIKEFRGSHPDCLLGTLVTPNPQGLGRILRDDGGRFMAIVEHKDATEEQRKIREVNMSTYLFEADALRSALAKLDNQNNQNEFYITDCPGILQREGRDVRALPVLQPCEGLSVNTVQELSIVEAEMQKMGYCHTN
jgi:bifunctional UDP-N-acetylglucosamine pyrophosphorylase/glucosamine-1-phosphate N-acetyltransferase/UDP-N-acetylglucosamine pyrophosphorylase